MLSIFCQVLRHGHLVMLLSLMQQLSFIYAQHSITDISTEHILYQVMHLDAEKDLMSQCIVLLGKFVCVREPNIRYLGLVRNKFCEDKFSVEFLTAIPGIINLGQYEISSGDDCKL